MFSGFFSFGLFSFWKMSLSLKNVILRIFKKEHTIRRNPHQIPHMNGYHNFQNLIEKIVHCL